MSFSARSLGVVLVLVAAVGVAGCGETVIDSEKTEGAIEHSLEKSLKQQISSVSCPSDQKVEKGATFTCNVKLSEGREATATLKILNEDADVSLINLKPNK